MLILHGRNLSFVSERCFFLFGCFAVSSRVYSSRSLEKDARGSGGIGKKLMVICRKILDRWFCVGFLPLLSHQHRFSFMIPLFPKQSLPAVFSLLGWGHPGESRVLQGTLCLYTALHSRSPRMRFAVLLCSQVWVLTGPTQPQCWLLAPGCACSLLWEESKFGASSFCRCCSNVHHLEGLQCMLESCQLCCDNIIACAAVEAFVLWELILGFCYKNSLSSTPWPNNLASAAFKGTKIAILLYLSK